MQAGKLVRLAAIAAVSAMTVSAVPLFAKTAAPARKDVSAKAAAPAKGYAALDKLPNWEGVWQPDWGSLFAGRGGSGPPAGPKLTPETAKILADYNAAKKEGKNLQTAMANCTPPGMPGIMRMPYPLEFVYSPGRVTILHETYSQVRRIYTDGRALPEDPDPQYNGNSVGKWVDGALVVDTNGLNTTTTLSEAIHPTEQTKLHEVFKEIKPGLIQVTTTIIDPSIYAEPYTTVQNYAREKDWVMREYVCEENNRDAADPFGRPSMDISKPDDKK